MERHKLLQDKTRENKDPQKLTARHPKHNPIPSILKSTYHLISNNSKLSNNTLLLSTEKKKTLSYYLFKSDIA